MITGLPQLASPEGLAALAAAIAGLALLAVAVQRLGRAVSWLGLAHALATIGVAGWVVQSWRTDRAGSEETTAVAPLPAEAIVTGRPGAFLLRADAKPLAASVHDLSNDALDLAALAAVAARERRLLLLDGSHGITPRHKEAITRVFGAPVPSKSPRQRVCATSSNLLPLVTTSCPARPTPLVLPSTPEPLATTPDGQATAATARFHDATAVLLLHGPADQPTAEDECLMTLARGGTCALLAALPEHAQRALAVEPGIFAETADRFGVPLTFEPLGDADCGAPRQAATAVTQSLETARNERDVIAARDALGTLTGSQPLTTLSLGKPASAESQLPHVRSFLTALKELPYWLTRCDELRTRLASITRVGFTTDGSRVALRTAGPLAAAAVVVVSIDALPRATARKLPVAAEPATGLEISRQGAHQHRVVVAHFANELRLDLAAWLAPPASTLRLPELDRSARLALPFALALGAFASLLQGVAARGARKPAYFPATSAPVTALVFVWIWYSISAASRGDAARGAYVESVAPGEAATLVFDDWPEPQVATQTTSDEAPAPAVDDTWAKLVAAAEASLPEKPAAVMRVVAPSGTAALEGGGTAKILILDDAGSRNWYFRKTPAFAAARAGWLAYGTAADHPEELDEADFVAAQPSRDAIIVALDPRFLEPATYTALAAWVKDGGRLAVGERWGDTAPSALPASPLAEALAKAGIGTSEAAAYSRVESEEGATFEIANAHRVVPQRGAVAGAALGRGAVIFLGTHPGASLGSDALVKRAILGMSGATLRGGSASGACKSLALLQPFGPAGTASSDILSALDAARVPAALALDAPSLVAMGGTLSATTRSRVVLADDGRWRSRHLGKALLDGLRPQPEPSLVAVLPGRSPADRKGPAGVLVPAVWLGAKLPAAELASWKRECRQGFARPRLFLAGAFADRDAAVQSLRSLGLDPSTTLATLAASMTPARNASGKARRALAHDPLNFED